MIQLLNLNNLALPVPRDFPRRMANLYRSMSMIGSKLLLERALNSLSPNELNTVLTNSGLQFQIAAQWYRFDNGNLVNVRDGGTMPPGAGLTQVTAVQITLEPELEPEPADAEDEIKL